MRQKMQKKRVQKPKLGPAKRARKRVRGAFQGRRTSRFAGNFLSYNYMKLLELFSGTKNEWGENFTKHTQNDLYKIPEKLIYDILEVCKGYNPNI